MGPLLAHWHVDRPRELEGDEHLVFIVKGDRVEAVVRREFNNLSTAELVEHKDKVDPAKLNELKH